MRLEVRVYMKLSVKLLAQEKNGLTVAEREAIASIAPDLEKQLGPVHPPPRAPLFARLREATFSADWGVF
jgi:hypothetical protein